MLVAFDIDGTLADITHRLHFIKDPGCLPVHGGIHDFEISTRCANCNEAPFKADWAAFFAACKGDKPIPEMIKLCNTFLRDDVHDVIFTTGRSEACRAATENWLGQHLQLQLRYPGSEPTGLMDVYRKPLLFMRTEGDHRPDYQVKLEMLTKIEYHFYSRPSIIFDDRQQVVDAWRSVGIRCCQVAKGDF